MSELIVKIAGDGDYPLDPHAALADLTGAETIMLEEYLGGWENFNANGGSIRSVIVTIWLAKHQAGKATTLQEIEAMKGLVFGDAVDMVEVNGDGPPAVAAPAAIPSTPADSEITGAGV